MLELDAPGAKESRVTSEGGNRINLLEPVIWQYTLAIT